MKLITAIVNKEDSRVVCNELVKHKFYVTRLATTHHRRLFDGRQHDAADLHRG